MAFDTSTRNRLAKFVGEARRLLTDEFIEQLQSLYGISATGSITPIERLGHLDAEGRELAGTLRQRIAYLVSSHADARDATEAAVARLTREQAFTIVNRLAAIRMAETRGLIVESVGQQYQSKGFKVFESVAGSAIGETFDRYRCYLFCLFDELAIDLGVLFDRKSPQARLFPREPALLALLDLLDAPDLQPLWAEDETIGWIYQYYNDEVERKKMREESAAPRNSRELAVRNQFFTPRYVVEFLTDNTLGRIWYEMTQGQTALKDSCRYLVHRPNEIFLKAGESASENAASSEPEPGESLSQEELLQQPFRIPHRPLKDPRDIRLLDPACGSMHFGLYAFDLFMVIYDEAWEIAHSSDVAAKSAEPFAPFVAFAANFADKLAFLRDVPRFIIEHNVHGIDIDPRAAQIAGLSLWLRAQRAWHDASVKPAERPRITRSNIVCAEPMPGEKELLREFVDQQFPAGEQPAFHFLLEKIFVRMALAGEAGSLLGIEEEIRVAIVEAKKIWEQEPHHEQKTLFADSDEKSGGVQKQLDLSGITTDEFWQRAEDRIYGALAAYAEQAEAGGGFTRRLFADDAAQGFSFIDLCRKRYDVVVMNPPFGEQTDALKTYLATVYPQTKNNLYCAFVDRAYGLCPSGIIGLISARTFVVYRDFETFREQFLLDSARIEAFADLGWEVLDGAQVETAAFVLSRCQANKVVKDEVIGPFIRLLSVALDEKSEALLRACRGHETNKNVYFVRRGQFQALPGSPLAYWASPKLVQLFSKSATFEPSLAYCGRGAAAHVFFFRLAWEIPANDSTAHTWRRLAHGGEYSPFFRENSVAIYWKENGREVKEYILKKYPYLNGNFGWAIQDEDKYGAVGLTSGKRNERFNVQLMPAGHIFTNEGQGFIPHRLEDVWFCLGYLNSSLVSYFLTLTSGLQKTWVYIRPVPVVTNDLNVRRIVETAAREAFEIKRMWSLGSEEAAWFICPWQLGGAPIRSIQEWAKLVLDKHTRDSDTLNVKRCVVSDTILKALMLNATDEEEVGADFKRHPTDVAFAAWRNVVDAEVPRDLAARGLSYLTGAAFGRWDIRYAAGERALPELPDPFEPLPVCSPGMLRGDDGLPLAPEAGCRLREDGHYPLDIAWDGILVDDAEHPLDIERRIEAALSVIWSERADAIEHEACTLFGVPRLRDWFRRPAGFFADHLKRYSKSRRQAPIYWPLSTKSGDYTLWIYYHRLNDQTLHKCLADFLDPKIAKVEKEIASLIGKSASKATELRAFVNELRDLRDEIDRVIKLPWRPNLNDGVLITASPLWKLFRLSKWSKDLKACWEELEKGDHDWAHLAYTIWPARVEKVCESDRSIAIAHGLEHLCKVEPPKAKKPRGKKATS